MAVYFLQTYTENPWHNLAVEKHLADLIGPGDVILYLWQNERTVVIGKNQNAIRECKTRLLEEDGGYLARRTTGGGAVYHDKGNLCFTFLVSPEIYDLQKQLQVIRTACQKFGIETCFSGRNDIITEDGFKFSGNAFSAAKSCNIQHGTLMINVDVSRMQRYLTPSNEKLKAKGIQSVRSRVCNLNALNPDITPDSMRSALKESFELHYGKCTEIDPAVLDDPRISQTYNLYASWDWRYGKSPECETVCSKRFDWGELQVHLTFQSLHISEIHVYSDMLDVEFPEKLEKLLMGKRYDMADVDLTQNPFGQDASLWTKYRETVAWLSSLAG